jgi:hypothetical protein
MKCDSHVQRFPCKMSYEGKRIYNKIVHSTFIGFNGLASTGHIKKCCLTKLNVNLKIDMICD